jgi:hypothetical protein
MSKYRNVSPASETIVGGMVGPESYERTARQIDLEMMNVDSMISKLARDAPSVDPSAYATWRAQKAEWDSWFSRTIVPGISQFVFYQDGELQTWLDRIAGWKARGAAWARAAAKPDLIAMTQAIPSSPAAVVREEEILADAKPSSPWLKIGIVGGVLLGLGWITASVAKVVRG